MVRERRIPGRRPTIRDAARTPLPLLCGQLHRQREPAVRHGSPSSSGRARRTPGSPPRVSLRLGPEREVPNAAKGPPPPPLSGSATGGRVPPPRRWLGERSELGKRGTSRRRRQDRCGASPTWAGIASTRPRTRATAWSASYPFAQYGCALPKPSVYWCSSCRVGWPRLVSVRVGAHCSRGYRSNERAFSRAGTEGNGAAKCSLRKGRRLRR